MRKAKSSRFPRRRPSDLGLLRAALPALLLVGGSATALAATPPAAPTENLQILDFWKTYSDAPNALYQELVASAVGPLRERQQAVARLRTAADWQDYRRRAQEKLRELVGPFPERTPLNARTLGVVQKDGFRIEKLVYESQPGLLVTAALFVPEPLAGPAPAILYCSGHTPESFRNRPYQHLILNLVKRGFIVLAFDPINQGERLQFFDAARGKSEIAASGLGHSHAGSPMFLLGDSLARLMIWDGIRGVDYLVSRREVDARRLGITGRSGGGTQTAYIAALDDRLLAAAPENYITTFELLLRSRGPQDAEQNFYGALARGFDQPDFLVARAPKPALLLATTRDIFAISGTQTAMTEARAAYAALGAPDAIAMNVDDAEHESTRANREATYAFFQRHLGLPGDATDIPVEPLPAADLQITPTGQLATSLGGETNLSLNRREAARLAAARAERRRDPARHLSTVRREAARLTGYGQPTAGETPLFSGRYRRSGYSIEKHLLPVDDRYAIPLLAFVPQAAPSRVVLYLHPDGKAAAAARGGEIEWLVRQGCAVVAPDVIGIGELGPGFLERGEPGHGAFRTWFGYVLMGRSIVGRQIQDVIRALRFAAQRFGMPAGEVAAVARGAAGSLLLHAAAVDGVGQRIALLEPLISYGSLASSRMYPLPDLQASVPSALLHYDLPDLAAALAPRRLLLAGPRAGSGAPATADELEHEMAFVTATYAAQRAAAACVLLPSREPDAVRAALAAWLR